MTSRINIHDIVALMGAMPLPVVNESDRAKIADDI